MQTNYISHHGILGQKWGVRRFQNEDGSLTSAGKARVSKKFREYAEAAKKDVNNQRTLIEGYNRAADRMNNGLIAKYNSEYESKVRGKPDASTWMNDPEYIKQYDALFNRVLSKSVAEVLNEKYSENDNFKKAKELYNKYEMQNFDDFAKKVGEDYADLLKEITRDD